MIKITNQSQEKLSSDYATISVNIISSEKQLVIIAPIAGCKKEDLDLIIDKETLTIKGERKIPEFEGELITEECYTGPIARTIILPLECKTDEINAKFEAQLLIIKIPKRQIPENQKINIESNEN